MDPLHHVEEDVLVDPDQPMVWRGPMASGALIQMIQQTRWQGVDYLLVDMPPGFALLGDIHSRIRLLPELL